MADDITDKIKAVLNNPDAMNMFSSLLNKEGSSEDSNSESTVGISDVKNIMDKIDGGNDKRISLLSALKPYMRNSRASNIDKAIKMLKITRISSMFKDL